MRTRVYVDGMNLYYGCLRGTPYRWLDIRKMCELLLEEHHEIERLKYFTANVSGRAYDLDAPKRQQVYLRALRTLPDVEIIWGHFIVTTPRMQLADKPLAEENRVRVVKTEEKGSDVNLATELLCDGFRNKYDVAVVVSNDGDLMRSLRVVRDELQKDVGVLHPILNPGRHPSKALVRYATFSKRIRAGVLDSSKLPNPMTDKKGTFHMPETWGET